MRTARGLLVALASSLHLQVSGAAEQCPLIRPAGLTPEQVRRVTLQPFEQSLQRQILAPELAKSVADLVGRDNAPLTYGLSAAMVGESLGFDALKEFEEAAIRLNKLPPAERLPLSDLLTAAVSAYQRGTDAPPPAVRPNAAFAIMTTRVLAPAPAEGWYLLRCRSQDVTFVRPRQDGQTTATVRVASLPTSRSDSAFLAEVKAMVEASATSGLEVQPWSPRLAVVNRRRCAEIETVLLSADRRVTYWGRVCYGANGSSLGHTVLFAHNGPKESSFPSSEAKGFINANAPE